MKEDHILLLKTNGAAKPYLPTSVGGGVGAGGGGGVNGGGMVGATTRGFPRLFLWLILFFTLTYLAYTLRLLSANSAQPCSTLADGGGGGGEGEDVLSSFAVVRSVTSRGHNNKNNNIIENIKTLNTSSSLSSSSLDEPPPGRPSPPVISAATLRARLEDPSTTSLRHVVFGIAASARLWEKRKEYIKLWWRPGEMRGAVWLDRSVSSRPSESAKLPPLRISANTKAFAYTNKKGDRSAIRISRIVSESLRHDGARYRDARWFVMGDDDTVFIPDNLLRVLRKLDHRQPYYVGSPSESHLQNIYFSYGMAYGGGGFAISRPLAESLSKVQDRCIRRYPGLYGSDDRMQACMAELGVPLTRHAGFHQYDVYGDLFGLLAAHPVAPLVTLHHLDVVEPVFPGEKRPDALQRLFAGPVRLDSAGVMQQSICYDTSKKWTVSVSWGFAVQIIRGVVSPREMEMPMRTFLNWYRRADYTAYAFNTRPVARNPCQRPFVYYLQTARMENGDAAVRARNVTVTRYGPRKVLGSARSDPACRWKMADPAAAIDTVVVYKRADPELWDRSPRRNCCRVQRSQRDGKRTMSIDVGVCRDGEISEV